MLAAQHCVCTKSGLKNEFTTRYVHVWRREEVQRTRFFFLMMLLEPYKRKELLSGYTWQLLAMAKGCCWFSISVEAFSDRALLGSNRLPKKRYQKFMVHTHKGNLEKHMGKGITIKRYLHGQYDKVPTKREFFNWQCSKEVQRVTMFRKIHVTL